MPGMLRCHRLEIDAFEGGSWREGLRELADVAAPPTPRTDGAAVVAAMIEDRLSAP